MHIDRMPIVQSMLDAVQRKYFLSGRLEDLNKGIDLGRQTIAAPNISRGDRRLLLLNGLANLLFVRYEVALSTDCDLEESVDLRREVLQCISLGSMFRWLCAANLADSLELRFMRKGDLQDLEESIELYRYAIDIVPTGHLERPKIFASLSDALRQRFHETRDAADLDEALVSSHYAMTAISPSHVDYWDISLVAISHLCIRFEVFQAIDDLDRAILLSEGLIKTIPDEHIQRDDTVRHLAKALPSGKSKSPVGT
jgi:tetratricopeptide (TPR) repeat protein